MAKIKYAASYGTVGRSLPVPYVMGQGDFFGDIMADPNKQIMAAAAVGGLILLLAVAKKKKRKRRSVASRPAPARQSMPQIIKVS